MTTGSTTYYEARFNELHERLVRILGLMTVNRLLERALAEIGRADPAVLKIRVDGECVNFDAFREAAVDATEPEMRERLERLNAVLLLFVARLLGNEVARRLTDGMALGEVLEWRQA